MGLEDGSRVFLSGGEPFIPPRRTPTQGAEEDTSGACVAACVHACVVACMRGAAWLAGWLEDEAMCERVQRERALHTCGHAHASIRRRRRRR